jgi:hypothetical protein
MPPRSAGDHLEEAMLVCCPHLAAVDAHRDRAIGWRLLFPIHPLVVE